MQGTRHSDRASGASPAPVSRALMPDYLRLVALFGIVVVNVQFIAFPNSLGFEARAPLGIADDVAAWAVNGFALFKTYGLFSFMFGVGLAFQIRAAERRNLPFGKLYRNRMIGLALFGLLHGVVFFPGDILLLYAVTGAILYRWRDWTVPRLVRAGAILLVVQILVAVPLTLLVPESPTELLELERATMTEGGVIDVVIYRAISFAVIFPFLLVLQGISALGWFCLGLAAVRSGMIDDAAHPLWARARRGALPVGVSLSLLGAALWQWGGPGGAWGEGLVVVAAPVTTLGYLGLIAALSRPPGPLVARLLAVGGSSLSIYLGQSIVLSAIFAPYGAALWGGVGPAIAVGVALAVTLSLMLVLMVWRTVFSHGPFEWMLRRLTYLGTRETAAR